MATENTTTKTAPDHAELLAQILPQVTSFDDFSKCVEALANHTQREIDFLEASGASAPIQKHALGELATFAGKCRGALRFAQIYRMKHRWWTESHYEKAVMSEIYGELLQDFAWNHAAWWPADAIAGSQGPDSEGTRQYSRKFLNSYELWFGKTPGRVM